MELTTPAVVIIAVLVIVVLWMVLKLYNDLTCGVCRSTARLEGKTVILTGGNSGIGAVTAMDLAGRGARLILACRNLDTANAVKDKIVEATKNNNVVVRKLDVSSLTSVRKFAEEILATEERLDVLIHNAGTNIMGKHVTEEGLNLMWATNYFGAFLLTHLLIELMKKTGKGRIIFVSSVLHYLGGVNLKNPNPVDEKRNSKMYCMSKFAVVLFAKELARRLEGTDITSNSLHPGLIYTNIWEDNPMWFYLILQLARPFFKSVEMGAQTTICLAVSEEVEGVTGKYFSDCKVKAPARKTQDPNLAKKYWELCEEIVGLKPSDPHI